MNYLLIPISKYQSDQARKNFNKTILNKVNLNINGFSINAPFWGLSVGKADKNRAKFEDLNSGDIVLFYNREESIFAAARVERKFNDFSVEKAEYTAKELWGDPSYHYIFQLSKVSSNLDINEEGLISNGVINKDGILRSSALITEENDYHAWAYLTKVLENDNSRIIATPKETQEQISSTISEFTFDNPDFKRLIKRDFSKGADRAIKGTARKEQTADRKFVIDNMTRNGNFKCAVCGRQLPTELMSTSHIVRRSDLDNKDKSNPLVVLPMCYLGCDKLFEDRFIKYDLVNKKVVLTEKGLDSGEELVSFVKENVLKIYEGSYKNEYLYNDAIFESLKNLQDKYQVIISDDDMPFMKDTK